MARSAKPRNSRNTRKPVTIDLDAETVTEESVGETSVDDTATPSTTEDDLQGAAAEENSTTGSNDEFVPTDRKSKANFSSISGGVIGGLLALVGGAILQWAGVLPSFAPQQAAIEQVDLTPVRSEIENLKSSIAALQDNSGATVSAETQAAIDAAVGTSQEAATKATDLEGQMQTLSAQIADIETNISAGAAGEGAGLEALANRITGLETEMATAAGGDPSIDALKTEIVAVEDGLVALQSYLSEQMATLGAQLAAAEEKMAGGTSSANVATAIASAGLKSAIDRGGSFMAELEAYASVSGDTETVAELRNYAASGVATINQLSDQFPAVHNRIIAVGEGLNEDASVADRLMASARSLVQVRTVGDVEGENPDQIAARIEARLKESDLAAALSEWETLPDAAQKASTGFADRLRARQSVDAMVAKALSGAMAASAPASN